MTGKVEIPAGAKKKAELIFLQEIVNNVEKSQIPSSLVLSLGQTNSKYVSMGKATMAEKGSNSVPISSLSDKSSMTATFTITFFSIIISLTKYKRYLHTNKMKSYNKT